MAKTALQIAVSLLARRDYSTHKLSLKLQAKDYPKQEITSALDKCKSHGWLDDQKYCKLRICACLRKGYGSCKILHLLKQDGIDANLATKTLEFQVESLSIDWQILAQDVLAKKYTISLNQQNYPDFNNYRKEQAKRARFLQSRGFTLEQIAKSLNLNN